MRRAPVTGIGPQRLRALLIENDPADAELMQAELREAGFDVVADVVQERRELEEKFDPQSYDLVLADYNLLGWTGREALAYLRGRGHDVPFILVSGTLGEDAAVECIKQGASDYVLKDRLGRLPLAVRRALDERRLIAEQARAASEIRQLNEKLERRVAERTAQLEAVNRKLQLEIAERRRAQAEQARLLRQTETVEARFRGLLESAPDPIVISNPAGRIVLLNRRTEEVFGYYRDQLLGKPIEQLVPERLRNDYAKELRRYGSRASKRLAGAGGLELFARRQDGREFAVEIDLSPMESQGETLMISIIHDVTRRQQSEEALRREKEFSESLISSSFEGILAFDRQYRYALWNPAMERMSGINKSQVLGKSALEIFPFLETPGEGRVLFNVLQGQGAMLRDRRYRARGSGGEGSFEASLSPLRGRGGEIVGGLAIIRDITEQKRASDALEALRQENERILNSAGDGICRVNRDDGYTFVNPAAARMLGWEAHELLGRNMHEIAHHSRADGSPYPVEECPVYAVLHDGVTRAVNDEVFWRRDGRSIPVEYVSTPIVEKGGIVGAVVTFRDITERRALEAMKDEFISVVSHELRTPLTSIRGALGLLASGKLSQARESSQRLLDVAVANTDRLVRLINDILDVERMASGRVVMVKRSCDAGELMVQAVEAMRPLAETAGVTLAVAPRSVELWADPDRIIQTFTNLLSNAIKFSPASSTVRLGAERGEGEIVFRIQDQGRGIPSDKLGSIFERFQQVDASDSRQGGSGLGLAICRSIVRQHGGRIWVESTPGEGSAFHFTLPLRREPGRPAAREEHGCETHSHPG